MKNNYDWTLCFILNYNLLVNYCLIMLMHYTSESLNAYIIIIYAVFIGELFLRFESICKYVWFNVLYFKFKIRWRRHDWAWARSNSWEYS